MDARVKPGHDEWLSRPHEAPRGRECCDCAANDEQHRIEPRRLRDRLHAVGKSGEAVDRHGGFAVVSHGTPIRIYERDRLRARLRGLGLLQRCCSAIKFAHAPANALFQEAVSLARRADGPVRSIPMPAREERPAIIVHVLPLTRSAYDIFAGSDVLVAVTEVMRDAQGPSTSLLIGLFDLTPAEARLASALASGKTLQQAAELQGIQATTARAYLGEIFHKTGTRQQSQLVVEGSAGALTRKLPSRCGLSAPPTIGHARSGCACATVGVSSFRSASNAIFPSFVQTPRACSLSSLVSFSATQSSAP